MESSGNRTVPQKDAGYTAELVEIACFGIFFDIIFVILIHKNFSENSDNPKIL